MPELPDVEVFRKYVYGTSMKKSIERVEVFSQRIVKGISATSLKKRLKNARFVSTERRGKYLFAGIEGKGYVIFHFGMTGFPKLISNGKEPPKHTRVMFHFEDDSSLAYSCTRLLGRVGWTNSIENFVEQEKLGVDAFDLNENQFKKIVNSSRGAIKTTLMNQSRIAGLGNIYSDEILFQSGLHPSLPCERLEEKQVKKLFKTMRRVLEVAVRHEANPSELPAGYLLPHRKENEPCPRCDTKVKKISVGGRSTYFCPDCQRKDK